MIPATVNLSAYRGDTWAQTFRFLRGAEPVDLSAATVAAEVRGHDGAVTALDVTVEDDPGLVTLRLPDPPPAPGTFAYDVEVEEAGVVTTWVRGRLLLTRDVTHEEPVTA